MNYTNLNISDSTHQFKYIIEKQDDNKLKQKFSVYDIDGIYHCGKDGETSFVVDNKEYWENRTVADPVYVTRTAVPTCRMNVYFPQFSVDTYERNVKYVININTWIRGRNITLFSTVVDRNGIEAIPTGPHKFLNNIYYEYISFIMPDPYYVIYGSEWSDFRNIIAEGGAEGMLNEGGSNLQISLCPVEDVNGVWIKMTGYVEAQSAMLLTDNIDDYMSCVITTNVKEPTESPSINCNVLFNKTYESLEDYLYETYRISADMVKTRFALVVKDKNDVYNYIESVEDGIVSSHSFTLHYDSWRDYRDGLTISVLFTLLDAEDEELETEWISIMSNNLFLDKDLFRYFVGENEITHVELKDIKMEIHQIDVVNKVQTNVVSMERPDDYKANIIKPVFFRVSDSRNITIHPAVTENICINLDAYKNKVNAFTLKIKDWTFVEIGRVPAGIIFKVVGEKIDVASSDTTGTYYILNDEGELVTTGNYTTVL